MPNKFEKYSEDIADFNWKYGLNFSLNSFDERARVITEFASAKDLNALYRSTFTNLYKKVLANCVDDIISPKRANPTEYYRDFEKMMRIYRDVVRKEGRDVPDSNGGWTKKADALDVMQKELEAIPDNKLDYAVERYKKGELRIRDMRAYVDILKDRSALLSRDQFVECLAPLYCYKEALKKVNAERSIGWRILNLPRFIGERRAIRKFEKYLKPRMASIHTKTPDPNRIDPSVERVKGLASDDFIPKLKGDVKDMIEQVCQAPDPVNERERVQIDPNLLTGKNVKIIEKINKLEPLIKDDPSARV